MELQNLTQLVNATGTGEESLIQGTEKAGVELWIVILPVTQKMRGNARRKGITERTHLILTLVIMNTREDINPVVENHLIKTEAESILDIISTEEGNM